MNCQKMSLNGFVVTRCVIRVTLCDRVSKKKKRIILYSFSTLIHNLSCCLLGRGEIMKKYAVQSAAGRIAAGTCKRVHITPILGTLYWLQVSFSIDYEVLLLDFKALSYIMACLSLYVPNCSLRYSTAGLLSARKESTN